MPRTGTRSGEKLGIEIDNQQPTYFPGDILSGCVTCGQPPSQQYGNTSIRLKLFGRVKTKYTVKRSNGTSIDRGRAVLFEEQQILHRGSLEPNGPNSWPFSIAIPTTSQPGFARRGDEFRPDIGYLPTLDSTHKQEVDVTKHALPSIMYYSSESEMSGKKVEAYIEYVLCADMGEIKAHIPLYIRQRSVPSPITDYKMQTRSLHQVIKTPKLLAEFADQKLTFAQKSSRFFRPSKTPRYTYSVKVEHPTVIQLEHPDPIPLKIYLTPDLNPEKTTICPSGDTDLLPPVMIGSMEMKLKGDVSVRCPGMMWDSGTTKNHTFTFHFRGPPQPAAVPIAALPAATNANELSTQLSQNDTSQELASTTSITNALTNLQSLNMTYNGYSRPVVTTTPFGSPHALNLGSHAAIYLGCSASSTLSQPPVSFKRQVYPTFSTYNIFLKYILKWKINLTCAGEEHMVSGEGPVTIVAPSEEQEAMKVRELGTQGMKKNYDDAEQAAMMTIQFIGQILQAVS